MMVAAHMRNNTLV